MANNADWIENVTANNNPGACRDTRRRTRRPARTSPRNGFTPRRIVRQHRPSGSRPRRTAPKASPLERQQSLVISEEARAAVTNDHSPSVVCSPSS